MKVPISISFDLELIQAIKTKCYAEKISVSEYVVNLISKALAENSKETSLNKKKGKK
ncbi:MAG: hypothetical protein IT232_08615 [Flavobacteriales bacterium]|nr:hypothetical protein [Flavobacteriales bacterium]